MSKFSLVASLALSSLIFVGCAQNIARFSVASTSNIPIANSTKGEYVTGKECVNVILGIPLGNLQNRVSGAVAKALEEAQKKGQPADALINVDISVSFWSAIIYAQNCVTAKGQAIGVK